MLIYLRCESFTIRPPIIIVIMPNVFMHKILFVVVRSSTPCERQDSCEQEQGTKSPGLPWAGNAHGLVPLAMVLQKSTVYIYIVYLSYGWICTESIRVKPEPEPQPLYAMGKWWRDDERIKESRNESVGWVVGDHIAALLLLRFILLSLAISTKKKSTEPEYTIYFRV